MSIEKAKRWIKWAQKRIRNPSYVDDPIKLLNEALIELEDSNREVRKERDELENLLKRFVNKFQGDWPTVSVYDVFEDEYENRKRLPVDDELRDIIVATRKAVGK